MKRLLDDPRYAGELRADLLRSRSAGQDYQTAAKLLQLRAAFSDNLPAASAREGLSSALEQAASYGVHPGWKLLLLAALGSGAGLFAYSALRASPSEVTPSSLVARPSSLRAEASVVVAPPTTSTPLAAAASDSELSAQAAAPREPSATALEARERPISDESSSRREIAQLVRMRALLDRDPAAAYRLARRAEREFPRGILAEERQALSIVALAGTGARDRARKHARQFFARYPQSPLRATVEAALER